MWCDHSPQLDSEGCTVRLGGHLRQGSRELEAGLLKDNTDQGGGEEKLGEVGHSWESFGPHWAGMTDRGTVGRVSGEMVGGWGGEELYS